MKLRPKLLQIGTHLHCNCVSICNKLERSSFFEDKKKTGDVSPPAA